MLCSRCKREAVPGKSRCQHHLDLHLAQMKRQRERRSRDRLCVTCGRMPPVIDQKRCEECAKIFSSSLKRSRQERIDGVCKECSSPCGFTKYRCATCGSKRRAAAVVLKLAAFVAYGGPHCSCPGCPEQSSVLDFLTIDHIDGGGNRHRREIGHGGVSIYRWLKNNGYPVGYRVLCYNCNAARHHNGGSCPHQTQNTKQP
jgi:hypothetical protein